MEIKCKADIKTVVGWMHDSEFTDEDFRYNSENKTFCLRTHIPETKTEFVLELYNVEKYEPLNLDKVKEGKATSGIFNDISVKNQGLDLTLISQDLRIILKLNKLEGKLEKKEEEQEQQTQADVFGNPAATSAIGNRYMFTGREYDAETGLYYYRARYYSAGLGRFLQTDPIGYN